MADYKYKLNIDVESKGLKETKSELLKLMAEMEKAKKDKSGRDFLKDAFDGTIANMTDAKKAIKDVISAIDKLDAKGKDLTIADLAKFNDDIGQVGVKIKGLDNYLEKMGKTGVTSIGKIERATYNLGYQVDKIEDKFSKLGDQIQHEMVDNVVRMGFDAVGDSLRKAVYFTKDLDRTLTDIQIVSGKSAEEMQEFAKQSNDAARALGSTTDEFANASLIFFQQGGYTAGEVQKLAEATTIASNITRQSTDIVADQLTAMVNAFGTETSSVMTDIVDVFAKIGAVSGSNFEELATATQKFASQAKTSGYEGAKGIQEMGAQIAVVVETTRQSADSIGIGFKTILSRIQGIKEDKSGEMVSKLSKSIGQLNNELKQLGAEQFEIFDQFGDLKGADELINQLGNTWHEYGDQLSEATKRYVMQEVAGVEQASRLSALFDNWDRYLEILDEAQNAQGTALQQQVIYMDSIDAKAAQLRTTFEDMVLNLNLDYLIKGALDGLTNVMDMIGDVVEESSEMGVFFSQILGTSDELGKTIGAWVPLMGAGLVVVNKFFSQTIASRMAMAQTQRQYMAEQKAQMAGMAEADRKIMETKARMSKSLGLEEAQRYGAIQEKIVANSITQLKNEEEKLSTMRKSVDLLMAQNKIDASLGEQVKKYTQEKQEFLRIQREIKEGEKSVKQIMMGVSDETKKLLGVNTEITAIGQKRLAQEKQIKAELLEQAKIQASHKEGDINKLKAKEKSEAWGVIKKDAASIDERNQALDRENVTLSRNAEQLERRNKKMQQTQAVMGGLIASTLGLTQITSGLSKIFGEEKDVVGGLAQSFMGLGTIIMSLMPMIQGATTGIMAAFAPIAPWIMGISLAAGALITILGGIKSEAEKTAEANSKLTQAFVEQKDRIDALKDSLRGVEDSYTELVDSGMDAVGILSSGNQELIDKYMEYANAVATASPGAVLGYDAQGRAIVDLTQNITDLTSALMEEERINNRMLSSNMPGYISEISTNYKLASAETNRMVAEQKNLQEQLKYAMEIGDTGQIKSLNARILELNTSLAEQNKVLTDTPALINANIVQPFFKGNEVVAQFNDSYADFTIKTTQGSKDLTTAVSSVVLNVDALNDAIRAGDMEKANQMILTAESSYRLLGEAIGTDKEKAEELAQSLMGPFLEMPQYMQQAAFSLQGVFGEQGVASLDKFDEKVNDVLNGTKSLDDAFQLNLESIDKAYGDEVQSKLDGLIKKQEELEAQSAHWDSADRAANNYYETMSDLKDQIEDTRDELDEYNESVEDGTSGLDRQSEILFDIIDALEDTPEGYNKVVEAMENVGEAIENLESKMDLGPLTEAQSEQLMSLKNQYLDMYVALNDESTAFYQNEILSNADWVAAFQESTGLVATDYSNLQELMNASQQAGVNVRSWLMSEETREFATSKAQQVYDAQIAEANKVSASYTSSINIIRHWGALKNAGFSTGQILSSVFIGVAEAIANAFIDMYNVGIDMSNKLANVLGGIWNAVAGVVNSISGFFGGGEVMGAYTYRGSDYGNASHVSWSKDYLAGQAQDKYDKEVGNDLILKPEPPGNKPTGGGKPGSGDDKIKPNTGGNGGGGKDKDKGKDKKDKDVKDAELDLDPLYEYNNALKLVENEIDILKQKEKDLFGKDLITNLQQQNELLAKKLQILKSEATVIDQQMANQKDMLSQKGFTFDASGMITNYNEMIEKLTNQANAKTGEAKEQAIADLKQIQETVKDYDKLLTDTSAKLQTDMIKIQQELQENYQKQIEVVIDVNLDFSKAYEKIYKFQEKFNKGFDRTDESLKNMGEYAESLMGDMKTMEDAIKHIANDTNLTEKQKGEMLKKYINEYMDAAENLDEVIKDMGEKITDSLEEGLELIEKTAEGYEKIKDYAEEYSDILKDIYGPAAMDDIMELYDVQIEAQKGMMDALKEQQALAQQYVDALEPGSEEWKKAKEELDEINMEIANNTLGLLDLMRDKMEDFFDLSREALEQDIFGGSLDDVEEAWDRINDQQEKYVSTSEKVAKIGKLQAQIQEEIAKTDDPKKKAQLQKFIDEELKALKEKDKLTEKEVERAEKLYVLMLKQQALQNQEMTAMMARLVRDESGNWSYEYVQDVNKVNEAQKELADGLEDLMNSDKDNLKENQEEMLDLYKQYFDDLEKLQEKAMAGEFESPEAFDKALEDLNKNFMGQFEQLEKEQDNLLNNMTQSSMAYLFNMYKQNGGQLGIFSSETEGVIGGLMGALESGNISWTDIIKGNYDLISQELGITKEEAQKAIEEMTSSIQEDFEESNAFIKNDYEDLKNKVQDATTDMSKAFADYFNGVSENMGNQKDAIDNLNTALGQQKEQIDKVTQSVKDEANAITNTLIPSYNALKDKYDKEINPKTQEFVQKLKDSITEIKNNNTAITGKQGLNEALDSLSKEFIESKNKANELIGSAANNTGLKGMEKSAIDAYKKITTLTGTTTKNSINDTKGAINGVDSAIGGVNSSLGRMGSSAASGVKGVIDELNKIPEKKTTTITLNTRDKIKSVKATSTGYQYTSYNGLKVSESGFGPPKAEGTYMTFKSGGYTGTWNGSEGLSVDKDRGKLAVLHQKELVLNAEDTKNLLNAVKINKEALNNIGTPKNNIGTVNNNAQEGDTIIQIENIELPGVDDATKFLQELKSLPNRAIQYKYSKKQ